MSPCASWSSCRTGPCASSRPLTGTVVWTVPGRSNRPIPSALPAPQPLDPASPEAVCAFCPGRYLETPPERSRLILDPDAGGPAPWTVLENLPAEQLGETVADFRRFPNLFEILAFEYWHANHGYEIPAAARARATEYAATPVGRDHVLAIKRTRMQSAGASARGGRGRTRGATARPRRRPLRQLARRHRRPPALHRRGDLRRRTGILGGPHCVGAPRLPEPDSGWARGPEPDQPVRPLRRGVPELAAPRRAPPSTTCTSSWWRSTSTGPS